MSASCYEYVLIDGTEHHKRLPSLNSSLDRDLVVYHVFCDNCRTRTSESSWLLATIKPLHGVDAKSGEPRVLPDVEVEVLTRFGTTLLVSGDKGALRAAARRTGIPEAAWTNGDYEVTPHGDRLLVSSRGEDAPNTYSSTHGHGWWTLYEHARI